MRARLGSSPSNIWRSIWSARALLEKGIRWKVGCGCLIDVWNDHWLPGPYLKKVSSNQCPDVKWVADLIDSDAGCWKSDLVRAIFSPNEALEILSIPLSMGPQPDTKVWCGEKSGSYSVRSGYRMLLPLSPNPPQNDSLFRVIWNSNCPSKMNIQCWKFIRNFVPTKINLCVRKVASDPTCVKCLQASEDIIHVLCECVLAKQVWDRISIKEPTNATDLSLHDWLTEVFIINEQHRIQEIIITLYALWFARNKFVFEGIAMKTEEIITYVRGYCLDLCALKSSLAPANATSSVCWSPPSPPFVKINVDARFNATTKSAQVGVLIRDSEGLILGAKAAKLNHTSSSFATEAEAVVHGVRLALDLGFRNAVVEGDALSIIKKLHAAGEDRSEVSALVWSALHLAKSFQRISFAFVAREGNIAAHELARTPLTSASEIVWVEEAPASVEALAAVDRRHFDPP
ncbi:hypothetical protein like AT4G29090 [Hibiscus trionum]|uniref:Uncharacterized protein n=1 Tax=Hibiscus trionum TaxID=183268 RepID=A0A9W7IHW0_HIBTR|nr:hypothetical protein like AT4G29090 [Hibiscus trionum]